jgi:predicted nucleotidyltransferase
MEDVIRMQILPGLPTDHSILALAVMLESVFKDSIDLRSRTSLEARVLATIRSELKVLGGIHDRS